METLAERASHRFEAHTGEVRMVLAAPDLPALFAQAARGLVELMVEAPEGIGASEAVELEVEGRDTEALLVGWLDELIFHTDTTGLVFPYVERLELQEGRLSAALRGAAPEAFKTSVKAATFHGLSVEQDEAGARASVILDV